MQIPQNISSNRRDKLIHWAMFNVSIALLPLFFNLISLFITNKFTSIHSVFYRGELLIISAAIAADATGEFIIGTISNKTARILTGGACVILLGLCSLLFAAISIAATDINQPRVTLISLTMFIATVLVGGITKYLAENQL